MADLPWSFSLQNFKALTREERKQALVDLGEKAFREKQFFEWIAKGAQSLDEMTNISKGLKEKISKSYSYESMEVAKVQTSKDGTKKYLLKAPDNEYVEAVFMKYEYGNSICVSTQVGCNMGCVFCASGIGGKRRNLYAWEMLDEFAVVQKDAGEPINHIVLMGMGEPFDNYEEVKKFITLLHDKDGINLSLRNITVSTCGVVPGIKQFAKDFPQANLAISLHRATQEKRLQLMPIAKKYQLDELMAAVKEYSEETKNRVTFEYVLIKGENDTEEDIKQLKTLLSGLRSHINLIPLNNVEESGMVGTSKENAKTFAQKLDKLGISCTVRRSLGPDISAACGQLRKNSTC